MNKTTQNLAAVENHFHSEAASDVAAALETFTDDVVWQAPAPNGLNRSYVLAFSARQQSRMRLVHIFEMRDGRIAKEIVFDMGRSVWAK